MRKKVLVVFLCLAMVLGVVACGVSNSSSFDNDDVVEKERDKSSSKSKKDDDKERDSLSFDSDDVVEKERDKSSSKSEKDDNKERDSSSFDSKDVIYREIDNSCISFSIKYGNDNDTKFSADNIEFLIPEFVSWWDEYDRFEKYKETNDLLIYKIYGTDEFTQEYYEDAVHGGHLEYLKEYLDKYVEEEEKATFREEYELDNLERCQSAAQKANEVYKENGKSAMQILVCIKETTDYYIIQECSTAFLSNIDAFIEGLVYCYSSNYLLPTTQKFFKLKEGTE